MAERGEDATVVDDSSLSSLRENSEQIAALIVQRAFMRSRLRRARAEKLGVEAIAERLVNVAADTLHQRRGSRRGFQLRNQLSDKPSWAVGASTPAQGPGKTWGPLLIQSQTRRVLFKRPSKAASGQHLAAAQICRRLRAVAGSQRQSTKEETTTQLPSIAGSPPTPLSESRFSRASAAHQLTPYRPRRSSRTPPSPESAQTEPIQADASVKARPLSRSNGVAWEQSRSPDVERRRSSRSDEDRLRGPGRTSLAEADLEKQEDESGRPPSPDTADLPSFPRVDDSRPTTSEHTASEEAVPTCIPSHSSVRGNPLLSHRLSDRTLHPGGSEAGSPLVGLKSRSYTGLGLSPFPGGTPPLPSKLVAKAAQKMDTWRQEVRQMRADLTKTYRSICKLQSILWESPSARRLLSPATLRQKRSPYRALRHTKLPPSPLSRPALAKTSAETDFELAADPVQSVSELDMGEARREPAGWGAAAEMQQKSDSGRCGNGRASVSGEPAMRGVAGKGGLVPGVFYLGDTEGGVPSGRVLDMGDLNEAFREGGQCEAGSPNRAASDTGVSDREHPAQRRLFEGDASGPEPLTGRAESFKREPHGSRDFFEEGARASEAACLDEGTDRSRDGDRGTGGSRGVADKMAPGQAAPLGILGFLQGLFSPVGAGKTGRESEGVNGGREREGEEAPLGMDSNRGMANGGRETSVSGRGVEGVSAAEPDTWHDALDEVLSRSPGSSPRPSKTHPAEDRPSQSESTPTGSPSRPRTSAVRSPALSIAAVHLPPLTSSYSTTPPALTPPAPLVFSPPRAHSQSSPSRNRVLVDRSHNEGDEPVLQSKRESWAAPPTPFRVSSENVPGNASAPEPPRTKTKRGVTPQPVTERGLLSSFYRAGTRPLPPVTREVLRQNASTRHSRRGGSPGAENSQRSLAETDSTPVIGKTRSDLVSNVGRHVKWWDCVEEEDKENGVAGKQPKERSPRYSPKHMSATPSKSILKQGVPVGPRSLAQARDMRLRKQQAQAALAPKLSGRALRVKGRFI